MKVLVTGTAGFIGSFVAERLLAQGAEVTGIDNINDYYDVALKYGRLAKAGIARNDIEYGKAALSGKYPRYRFLRLGVEDRQAMEELFARERFDAVCHLAAQAGVRYSLLNPHAYTSANIEGFLNILEGCRRNGVKHLVYASSSSVYGANTKVPFSEDDRTDSPVSLYAATKKANEEMAESYCRMYGMKATGLRFFTVYGPWGRPDMAAMIFAKAMQEGRPIEMFNHGDMSRDFTYIDDIVEGVVRIVEREPEHDRQHRIYNIGHSSPVDLKEFVGILEEALDMKADIVLKPMQAGDVPKTWADCSRLEADYGYKPQTELSDGIAAFARWYREENPLNGK